MTEVVSLFGFQGVGSAHAPLAQLVEQLTLNQWVLGSNPRRRTNFSKKLPGRPGVARWSSGQDGGLSRRKREFDSPTGHQVPFARKRKKVLDKLLKGVIIKKVLRKT